jgi:aryl-alcohol dehydrogenase
MKSHHELVVFGAGAVGLSAVMAAKCVQGKRIIAVDLNDKRLQLAQELGATHTIRLTGKETAEEITKKIKAVAADGVDFALDTAGSKTALRAAVDALKNRGIAGLIAGTSPGTEVNIDMLGLLPGKQVRGIIQGDAVSKDFIPKLIKLHNEGKFPYTRLIKVYEGLESLNQAAHDAHAGIAIKPVIRLSK